MNRYDLAKGVKPDPEKKPEDELSFLMRAYKKALSKPGGSPKAFKANLDGAYRNGLVSEDGYKVMNRTIQSDLQKIQKKTEPDNDDEFFAQLTRVRPPRVRRASSGCSPSSNLSSRC